jgi:ankyrin repeat protein
LQLGYTALHRAAAQGHVDVVAILVTQGCRIDWQDDVVRSTLISQCSKILITEPLLQHGNAALHEAAWNGYSRTLDALIKHKANIHIVNKVLYPICPALNCELICGISF